MMSFDRLIRIDLRRLILFLALCSALIMLANGFYASYQVQRQLLIDNALEANHAYAAKQADNAADFFKSAQQQLTYSAGLLALDFDSAETLRAEAERLRLQTDSFNSIIITDAQGTVRATSPESLHFVGQQATSPGAMEALKKQTPLISEPYVSGAGNLIVFISQPVHTSAGQYLGYVGGSIYLKQKSILNRLLGEAAHRDGSYLYAVDRNRRLLYHPDPKRVGTIVGANEAIDALVRGESGSRRIVNSMNVDVLAGYKTIPASGWGVVVQRPTDITLQRLNELMLGVLRHSAPLAAVTLLAVWLLSRLIARPLWQLAKRAQEMDAPASFDRIHHVRSWYFEVAQLKNAMLLGIGLLQQQIGKLNLEAQTDPLTGLSNRRGMENFMQLLQAQNKTFTAIVLDIDHFKRINDSHGHDVGDRVLKNLAELMRTASRDNDLLCRTGGEEFLMVAPDIDLSRALRLAERLRKIVEQAEMPIAGRVTVSLGIAQWPLHGASPAAVLKASDHALYQAKRNGRNRVETAGA